MLGNELPEDCAHDRHWTACSHVYTCLQACIQVNMSSVTACSLTRGREIIIGDEERNHGSMQPSSASFVKSTGIVFSLQTTIMYIQHGGIIIFNLLLALT